MNLSTTFSGKSVLVTGAASGIGLAIAQQCASHGAYVLLIDIVDSVHDAASAIGANADSMTVDVTDREQLEHAIEHVVEHHGAIDFIFNNAGIAIFGDVEVVTLDEWDRIIDVNLTAVAYGTTLAYKRMVAQGSGHIINTASAAGLVPVPLQTHYVTTKHALLGMGKSLALEAKGHGVHVTTFCPAFVQTGMSTNNTLRGRMDIPDVSALIPISSISADTAARRLLHGVARRRNIVVTPLYARLGWWLERFSPYLSQQLHQLIFRRTIRRANSQAKTAGTQKPEPQPKSQS